jgi:hypothetical protein
MTDSLYFKVLVFMFVWCLLSLGLGILIGKSFALGASVGPSDES